MLSRWLHTADVSVVRRCRLTHKAHAHMACVALTAAPELTLLKYLGGCAQYTGKLERLQSTLWLHLHAWILK